MKGLSAFRESSARMKGNSVRRLGAAMALRPRSDRRKPSERAAAASESRDPVFRIEGRKEPGAVLVGRDGPGGNGGEGPLHCEVAEGAEIGLCAQLVDDGGNRLGHGVRRGFGHSGGRIGVAPRGGGGARRR
jgi:hypothetical protein